MGAASDASGESRSMRSPVRPTWNCSGRLRVISPEFRCSYHLSRPLDNCKVCETKCVCVCVCVCVIEMEGERERRERER